VYIVPGSLAFDKRGLGPKGCYLPLKLIVWR
jgi:hypothetical protein